MKQWHFFVSSVAHWRTGKDLETLIKFFKAQGYNFNVFLVPVAEDYSYEIDWYAPQVEGSYVIASYTGTPTPTGRYTRWEVKTSREQRTQAAS
jgi:hypothetical protein